MEEIDGQHLRALGGAFIRVRQAVVLALVITAALWLLAIATSGTLTRPGVGPVPQPVTHVTVAPAAGRLHMGAR